MTSSDDTLDDRRSWSAFGQFPHTWFDCEPVIPVQKRGGLLWLPKGSVVCASRMLVVNSGGVFLLFFITLKPRVE